MAKKANKQSVDKVVKKVNKEFDKTSSQIEKLINDALKQFDSLQNQIQEPVRKLLKEVDELRDREMKRFNEEFERRLGEFHDLQNNILDRLGIASKEASEEAKKVTDQAAKKATTTSKGKSAPKKTTASKAAGKKPAAKKPATPKAATAKKAAKPKASAAAKSPAAATKAAPKKATAAARKPAATKRTPKPKDKSDLTQVKGIGPATARKMKDAGITSVDQIANPSDADKEKLQAFSSVKGFNTFSDEAKKVI
ncbi:helix-hairpin-helix domain-containing protein [Marinobacter sp.]|uniref:helix-hairpin-helix domain-containing protein n=1 Tax=Marinobacter sp. TaxID=50741 RepID=UPI002626F15C|nr:helix-hairpin-helix domain-containing protein [Marinobacter sp.]